MLGASSTRRSLIYKKPIVWGSPELAGNPASKSRVTSRQSVPVAMTLVKFAEVKEVIGIL